MRSVRTALDLLLFASLIQPMVAADKKRPVIFDREATAAREGAVDSHNPIVLASPSTSSRQSVASYEYPCLAVRFRIKSRLQGRDARWRLTVEESNGKKTSYEAAAGATVWSDKLGPKGKLILTSINGTRAEIKIDKIALVKRGASPQAMTANALEPLNIQPDRIKRLAKSVAKLGTIADSGDIFVCSAFLISDDAIMTNEHCIRSRTELESALLEFDYDDERAVPSSYRLARRLLADVVLDLAVYSVVGSTGRSGLTLSSSSVTANEGLIMIQHPDGGPTQVSLQECHITLERAASFRRPMDFGHRCDTRGGSSGSPAINFDNTEVVGLHHLGFEGDPRTSVNLAVWMSVIKACIEGSQAVVSPKKRPEHWKHARDCAKFTRNWAASQVSR